MMTPSNLLRKLTTLQRTTRLFCPSTHLWLNLSPPTHTLKKWNVRIGLTDRCFEDIGDIETIQSTSHFPTIKKGDELLKIHWCGQRITTADELYHTVWETIEGEKVICAPISGELHGVLKEEGSVDRVNSESCVASFLVEDDVLGRARKSWMKEDEYLEYVRDSPRGMFIDD